MVKVSSSRQAGTEPLWRQWVPVLKQELGSAWQTAQLTGTWEPPLSV